jgi:sugar phosphate isomerase/epimerase
LGGFEVLGHIHWEITDFNSIKKNIEMLKKLGARKITIHPFQNLTIGENANILNELNVFIQNNKMELLIENVSSLPSGTVDYMEKLLERVHGARLTLDVGHANRNLELDGFINKFATKIKHIHLHYNIGHFDHLFYGEKEKINEALYKIDLFGYKETILLETFSIMKGEENISQEFSEIKELHIEQLKKIYGGPTSIYLKNGRDGKIF